MTRFFFVLSMLGMIAGCGGAGGGTGDAGLDARAADAATDDATSDAACVEVRAGCACPTPGAFSCGLGMDLQCSAAGVWFRLADGCGGLDAGTRMDSGSAQDACAPPPCEPPGPGCHYEGATACTCGTLVCTPSSCEPPCSATDYCDLCAASPSCVMRPADMGRICIDLFMPVCGCDGMTYSNSCRLASAGIGLLHDGACDAMM